MALVDENILRRRRATFMQLETIWEFLDRHRELATGYNKSAQAREHSKRLWISIAEALNSQGEGATKDWKGWSNYWVDYKAKLKRRAAAVRSSHHRTGGGPSHIPPLNEIENKFMALLGNDFGAGLPNIQVNPFPILPHTSTFSEDQLPNITPPLLHLTPALSPQSPSILPSSPILVPPSPTLGPPSPTLAPPSPTTLAPPTPSNHILILTQNSNRNRRPPIQRRRTRDVMTAEVARRTLVDISKQRLDIERSNQKILEQMLVALNTIADKISRISSVPQAMHEAPSDS